jgi:LmbE family N-acetylglucosaminyl deacetylase
MDPIVLSILAHPDDAEFLCAGAMVRLVREHGWQAHIATMTAGDCGSVVLPPLEISSIRRAEGAKAAGCIGATYHCLEEKDLLISYGAPALEKVVRLLRQVRPQVVLTHSPADYMLDHEVTSSLVRAAAFAAPVRNCFGDRGHGPPLEHIPYLYYCDAIEGKDLFGQPVEPEFVVDISSAMATKVQMLTCHASQREWLLRQHGMDEYVETMKGWCVKRGQEHQVAFAEGFRQHLGHSYPQDNLLGRLLGSQG